MGKMGPCATWCLAPISSCYCCPLLQIKHAHKIKSQNILKPTTLCQEVKKQHSTNFEISFGIKINLSLQLPMASKLISPAFVGFSFFSFSGCRDPIVLLLQPHSEFVSSSATYLLHSHRVVSNYKNYQKISQTFTFISSLFSL